jgi:hypothetical protein
VNCFQPFRPCPALRPCPARPGPFALVLLMMQPASITTCLQCQSRRAALSLRSASSSESSSSSNQRRHSGRHRTGATAGQAAQARGAAGPGRRQPASARGDDTTASPGRRLSVRTVIVRTTAAASAVARGTPSRTFPRARAGKNMHAHNLNATARFHCSHPAWKDEIITPLSPFLNFSKYLALAPNFSRSLSLPISRSCSCSRSCACSQFLALALNFSLSLSLISISRCGSRVSLLQQSLVLSLSITVPYGHD